LIFLQRKQREGEGEGCVCRCRFAYFDAKQRASRGRSSGKRGAPAPQNKKVGKRSRRSCVTTSDAIAETKGERERRWRGIKRRSRTELSQGGFEVKHQQKKLTQSSTHTHTHTHHIQNKTAARRGRKEDLKGGTASSSSFPVPLIKRASEGAVVTARRRFEVALPRWFLTSVAGVP
jgi:hypothetical protein